MAINALQPILREATGKELQFTGDFHAYWDQLGIPPGQFAERMAAWQSLPQNAAWLAAEAWGSDGAFDVGDLWKAGEQGIYLDASDLSTMFQDAAGTTPVYAPGQGQIDPPVGLWLDKRLGLARGPELWADASVTLFGEASRVSPGVYRVYTSSGAFSGVQIGGLTPGKYYELTLDVSLITAVGSGLACDGTTPAISFNTLGGKRYILRANSNILAIKRNAAVLTDIQISAVSVREVFGNHAYQVSTTSRPTLSARYNLVNQSEGVSTPAWSKFVGGTASAPVVTENFALSPRGDMTADRVVISRGAGTSSGDYSLVSVATGAMATAVRTIRSVWMKSNTGATQNVALYDGAQNVGGAVTVTPEWKQFFLAGGTVGASSSLALGSRGGDVWFSNSQADLDICVWGADIRAEGDGIGLPSYQRVADASNYDTAGFPLYLKFDGVDDFLQTASVDFSGTDKLFATAALRKLSDASAGVVVELSAVSNTNNGSFALLAPAGPNDTLAVYMRGATALTTSVPSGVPSPASRVFTGVMDTSEAVGRQSRSRLNGAHYAYASQDSGGGNFGNYPLYIGRRGGTSLPFNGRLYALLIRSGATPDSLILKAERYLNQQARIY